MLALLPFSALAEAGSGIIESFDELPEDAQYKQISFPAVPDIVNSVTDNKTIQISVIEEAKGFRFGTLSKLFVFISIPFIFTAAPDDRYKLDGAMDKLTDASLYIRDFEYTGISGQKVNIFASKEHFEAVSKAANNFLKVKN